MLAAVVLAATGCFRVDYGVTVADDGSGTIEALVALDTEALTGAGGVFGELGTEGGGAPGGASPEQQCEEFRAQNPPPAGFEVEPYEEDGFCGFRLTGSWAAGEDPDATLGMALSDGDGVPADVTLEQDAAGGWTFALPFEVEGLGGGEMGDTGDMGGDGGSFEDGDAFAQMLFGDASFVFRITLPGRPIEGGTNATSVDGNTFTWDIDLLEPPDVLRAQTEPGTPDDGGDGGFPWLVVAGVVAGLAIIVGMVVLVRRGSRTITDPVPPMTVPSGPTAAAPPAAPQPTYDAGLGAWVVDDPVRGRLQHDPVTGQWLPLGPPQA